MTQEILDIGAFTEPLLVFGGPYSNLAATKRCVQSQNS